MSRSVNRGAALVSSSTAVTDHAVLETYSKAAKTRVGELCCPISYDPTLLKAIPQEVIERDYGCGDPSAHVMKGDTVLDLGSGAGKICFIAAQLAGPKGKVIGVDFNDDMLALARKHQSAVARALDYDNVRFLKAHIQDLATPMDEVEAYLRGNPVRSSADLERFEKYRDRLRDESPLIATESVDIILSNCVLNLVRQQDKRQLFAEMFRVLKRGGRAAISDIVSDEDIPRSMQNDPELWSGCISGAFREDLFLRAFEDAGFHGIQIESYAAQPWRTIRGIEFRSMTVTARKGKEGPCWERNQAVMYLGPWKKVEDDDGHVLLRGQRMAVCDKTFQILKSEPYDGQVQPIEPLREVPQDKARPFACGQTAIRDPRQTKGKRYRRTSHSPTDACCGPEGCC